VLLALSALDVAFVSALAAAAAAVAAPISAYAVARANHKHDRWHKTYEDRRTAYQRLLRVIHAGRITASGFAKALESGDPDLFAARATATETADETLDRAVAVGAFAADAVRDAVAEWNDTYHTLDSALRGATYATDAQRQASAKAIGEAIEETAAAVRKIEDAIRADLRKS
jgi:hypothetical protein